MTRGASKAGTDFVVPVDGVGTFTFARRVFRDQFAIAAEYGRLSEGQPLTEGDAMFATMAADIRVLMVQGPVDWDIDTLDPADGYSILDKVWSALRDKEKSFRAGVQVGAKTSSQAGGANNGDLVPASLQFAAD